MRLISMSAILLLIITANAEANYKRDYCNNQDYYTNNGSNEPGIYPHLHCGRPFIIYSRESNSHYNFLTGDHISTGTAGSACDAATDQKALALKKIIGEICDDYGKTCNGC